MGLPIVTNETAEGFFKFIFDKIVEDGNTGSNYANWMTSIMDLIEKENPYLFRMIIARSTTLSIHEIAHFIEGATVVYSILTAQAKFDTLTGDENGQTGLPKD